MLLLVTAVLAAASAAFAASFSKAPILACGIPAQAANASRVWVPFSACLEWGPDAMYRNHCACPSAFFGTHAAMIAFPTAPADEVAIACAPALADEAAALPECAFAHPPSRASSSTAGTTASVFRLVTDDSLGFLDPFPDFPDQPGGVVQVLGTVQQLFHFRHRLRFPLPVDGAGARPLRVGHPGDHPRGGDTGLTHASPPSPRER